MKFNTVDGYNLSITDAAGKRFTGLDVKNNPLFYPLITVILYFVLQKI